MLRLTPASQVAKLREQIKKLEINMAHQEIEWVDLEQNVAGSRMNTSLQGFRMVFEFGIMYGRPN